MDDADEVLIRYIFIFLRRVSMRPALFYLGVGFRNLFEQDFTRIGIQYRVRLFGQRQVQLFSVAEADRALSAVERVDQHDAAVDVSEVVPVVVNMAACIAQQFTEYVGAIDR